MKKNILDGNSIYILWFTFYYILTLRGILFITIDIMYAIVLTTFIYVITISFAFSPAGEKLFKLLNGVRPLYTNKEKEKILPIAREIYLEITKKFPSQKRKIEICISDSLLPNAFAMGEKTIVVTKGLLESMTDEQIKGILAHELGHINHGDTEAVVFTFIGNGILNITEVCVHKFLTFFIKIFDAMSIGMIGTIVCGIFGTACRIVLFLFESAVFLLQEGGEIILMAKRRRDEMYADYYAYKTNYGEELVSALYELELMTSGKTLTIMEMLKSSHPHTAKRIGNLENWLGVSIR